MSLTPRQRVLLAFLVRQYNLGTWLGAAKDLLSRTTFYTSTINTVLLLVTAYYTTLRNVAFFRHIPFAVFVIGVVALIFIAMLMEYKFVVPSSTAFSNQQFYKHKNPIKRDFEKVMEMLTDEESQTLQSGVGKEALPGERSQRVSPSGRSLSDH